MSESNEQRESKDRYGVIEGSESGHCCFEWTIVDHHTPNLMLDGRVYKDYTSVCECWYEEDAIKICEALNRVEVDV